MRLFRNLKVGTKLFAILLAPVVVLVALATIGATERFEEASDAERLEELAQLAGTNADVIQELHLELVASAVFMGSEGEQGADELAEQRDRTDEARAAYESELRGVDLSGSPELEQAAAQTETRLNQLVTQRTTVDDFVADPPAAVGQLDALISDLVELNAAISRETDDPTLARQLNSFVDLGRVNGATAHQGALLTLVTQQGAYINWETDGLSSCGTDTVPPSGDADCRVYEAAASAGEARDRAEQVFTESAPAASITVQRDETAGIPYGQYQSQLIEAGQGAGAELPEELAAADPDVWLEATLAQIGALYDAESILIQRVLDEADTIAANASTEALFFLVGTALAVVIALVFALLMARATAGPLRRLTSAAYTLSTERLPVLVERLRNPGEDSGESLTATLAPIEIDSRDEIGQLAEAFNSIQQVTVEVAEEQAQLLRKGIGDIFINLARRNQTLLDRQIEFIDQLEANEEDPDQLDNLFKLDHLATRMRRNAESLLVLAGAEPPRRRGRPVELTDVVRVAIGEVEDFARIQLTSLDEATVGGNVAVDLAHLLSELMENATHFSPPDSFVEVVGRREGASYTLAVIDRGIGMGPEQVASVNRLLAQPPLVGLALSRSLGFIVIGRLAARFGIGVRLESAPSGGVTALVSLPSDVVSVAEGEPVEPSQPLAAAETSQDADERPDSRDAHELIDAVPEPVGVPVPEVADEPEHAGEDWDDDIGDALIDELYRQGAIPEEEFERGLRSLVSDDLPAGPVEPVVPEPGPGPRPTPGPLPPLGPDPDPAPAPEPEPEPEPAVAPMPQRGTPEPASPMEERPTAEITAAGLVRRTPKRRSERAADESPVGGTSSTPVSQSQRSPEEIRRMLSRYRSGLNKGRTGADAEDEQ